MIAERTRRNILWFLPAEQQPIDTEFVGTPDSLQAESQ